MCAARAELMESIAATISRFVITKPEDEPPVNLVVVVPAASVAEANTEDTPRTRSPVETEEDEAETSELAATQADLEQMHLGFVERLKRSGGR